VKLELYNIKNLLKMIVNNYNKSLAEIKETDESFWEIKCPQLFVGEFDFRIPKGSTLVIPYRVY